MQCSDESKEAWTQKETPSALPAAVGNADSLPKLLADHRRVERGGQGLAARKQEAYGRKPVGGVLEALLPSVKV